MLSLTELGYESVRDDVRYEVKHKTGARCTSTATAPARSAAATTAPAA